MDLFESQIKDLPGTPLAESLRPRCIQQFVGQTEAQKVFNLAKKNSFLPSLILWGPPGTGKTSFATMLANEIDCDFISTNATSLGVKEIREQGELAHEKRLIHQRRTILFIDEIHRLNKGQQDVLLPFIEKGDFTLIGATTENPSYDLNSALMSRCRLVVFQKLSDRDLSTILQSALEKFNLMIRQVFQDSAVQNFLQFCDGDARSLIKYVEDIVQGKSFAQGPLSTEQLSEVLGQKTLKYDRAGDEHYDTISAFIKSIRGSDADAALYYLAKMLKAGEDPRFIARRLVILSSEDVGNADPKALPLVVAAAQAVEMIGLPEAAINLAQAVTYLASAPKSNRSYMALKKAQEFVEHKNLSVPLHLRSAQTALMRSLHYGDGYRYPHDYAKSWVDQHYTSEKVGPFYEPKEIGYEKSIAEFQKWLKSEKP